LGRLSASGTISRTVSAGTTQRAARKTFEDEPATNFVGSVA
jgi:hypothetical protein